MTTATGYTVQPHQLGSVVTICLSDGSALRSYFPSIAMGEREGRALHDAFNDPRASVIVPRRWSRIGGDQW